MNRRIVIRRLLQIVIISFLSVVILMQKMNIEIKTVGKIFPKSDYRIIQEFPNSLKTETNYYFSSSSNIKQSFNFERDDVIEFDLSNQYAINTIISKHENIGVINSTKLNYEILVIEGKIVENQALLKSYMAGKKKSIIEEANNRLELRKAKLDEQKLIVDRMKELNKSNLISAQEYERAKTNLNVCEIEVLVAKSNLTTVLTGEKPEMIDLVKSNIFTLQNKLNLLNKKKQKYSLLSPISGITYKSYNSDTLFTIEDQSTLGVMFPIKLEKMEEVNIGQVVTILLPELKQKTTAKIIKIENRVTNIHNNQIFIVTAILEKNTIPSGSLVKCKVQCGSESIFQNIYKMFRPIEIN